MKDCNVWIYLLTAIAPIPFISISLTDSYPWLSLFLLELGAGAHGPYQAQGLIHLGPAKPTTGGA